MSTNLLTSGALSLVFSALLYQSCHKTAHAKKISSAIFVVLLSLSMGYWQLAKSPIEGKMSNMDTMTARDLPRQLASLTGEQAAFFCSQILFRAQQQDDFAKSEQQLLLARQCYSQSGEHNVAAALVEAQILRFDNNAERALQNKWLYQRVYLLLQLFGIGSPEFQLQLQHLLEVDSENIDALWLMVALNFYRGNREASLQLIDKLEVLIKKLPSASRAERTAQLAKFRQSIENAQ